MQTLSYYYFGYQCPGDYMGIQAEKTANLLGCTYQAIDITDKPELALRHNLFFPGTITYKDTQLVYPGAPEIMAESLRTGQPTPGNMQYKPHPQGHLERIEALSIDKAALAFRTCLPYTASECFERKTQWLKQFDCDFFGYAGYVGNSIVAFAEILPENRVPYPLPRKSPKRGFITCLYSPNEHGLEIDYRRHLLQLILKAQDNPYLELSIVAGTETPYPNGPEPLLRSCGFSRVHHMGRVMLRHKWEECYLLTAATMAARLA